MWISSEEMLSDKSSWLQNMRELSNEGLVILDDQFDLDTDMVGSCLSIIHSHNNSETIAQSSKPWATLTSSSCTMKKSVACKLDNSEETLNIKPIPFPCISANVNARKKRTSENVDDNGNDSLSVDDFAGGELWIIYYIKTQETYFPAVRWLVLLIFFDVFYVSEHCTCTNFVNKNGYGNCMKEFNGKGPICYVKEPSTCTDLKGSTIADGRNYSWNACSNQGYHFNIFIFISKEKTIVLCHFFIFCFHDVSLNQIFF